MIYLRFLGQALTIIIWVRLGSWTTHAQRGNRQKFNPNHKFLGMADAYFVCHIGPIFQISLIYSFIGCPQSVVRFIAGFSQFIDQRFETLQPNRHQNCPKCNLLQSSSRFKNLVQPSRWEACWLTIKVMGCGPDGINIRLPTL